MVIEHYLFWKLITDDGNATIIGEVKTNNMCIFYFFFSYSSFFKIKFTLHFHISHKNYKLIMFSADKLFFVAHKENCMFSSSFG